MNNKTCSDCRFCENTKCVRFNIDVDKNYVTCDSFSEKTTINECVKMILLFLLIIISIRVKW